MKGRFSTYFRQTSQSFLNSWLDQNSQPTMAGLHDLRLFLKKIKFCQLFLSWVYGKSELGKLPDLTRQVFKQAGLIRELQLVRDWLRKENIKIDKELQCDEPSIQQQLLQLQILLSDNQLQVSKLIKKAELLANKINPILSDQYWQELNANLKKNLKKAKKKDWHEIRKLIKRWTYALNCLEELPPPSKVLVQVVGKLEKNIGDWHEYSMILQRLDDKEPVDTDPLTSRTQFALTISRAEEQMEAAERKTERQMKKVLELL